MGNVLTGYKIDVVKRRRRIRDLAESLGMDYSKVSRIINGYDHVPPGFDSAVQGVFRQWDSPTETSKVDRP